MYVVALVDSAAERLSLTGLVVALLIGVRNSEFPPALLKVGGTVNKPKAKAATAVLDPPKVRTSVIFT
jgi:hypothetical protein